MPCGVDSRVAGLPVVFVSFLFYVSISFSDEQVLCTKQNTSIKCSKEKSGLPLTLVQQLSPPHFDSGQAGWRSRAWSRARPSALRRALSGRLTVFPWPSFTLRRVGKKEGQQGDASGCEAWWSLSSSCWGFLCGSSMEPLVMVAGPLCLPPQAIEKLVALLNTRWTGGSMRPLQWTSPLDLGTRAYRTWYARLDQVRGCRRMGLGAGVSGREGSIQISALGVC